NRNWQPLLPDALRQMADDGVQNALAFVTSAYSSYSSCRQYRENIANAQAAVGAEAPRVDKLRAFYNHPLFVEANVEHIRDAWSRLDGDEQTQLVFTAHSIPETMAANCDYAAQLQEAGSLIAGALGIESWRVVYQSRSGSPMQPWLGPDIGDYLRELKAQGIESAVVAPIGFVSDHMEIIYDLDFEAQNLARELGIQMVRAATAGTHPAFVKMIRELILERVHNEPRRFLGSRGPVHDVCPADCCLLVR
ncbi:MAG TPA: ferrochelatase, partial [Pyrinomonadaceae bacterium]